MKILSVIPNFSPKAKAVLDSLGHVTVLAPVREEILPQLKEVEILLTRLEFNVDKEAIDAAPNLKVIGTATTGLDHIDLAYAKEKGITVLSLKEEQAFLDTITGTAELAWALLLDIYRHIIPASTSVLAYEWKGQKFVGNNLYGKTLGVVGLGRLGKMTARYGKAFGMRVLFTDPNVSADAFPEYEKVEFEKLLQMSDVVSIHVHLNDKTKHLFSEKEFSLMKPEAILINTSRGDIVHEADLLKALQEKKVGGYGTDVLSGELQFEENGFANHPLVEYAREHPKVIIVPHIGGLTFESREATDVFIAEKVKKYLLK